MKLYVMKYRDGMFTHSTDPPEPQEQAPPPDPSTLAFTPTPQLPQSLRVEHIELLLKTGAFTLGLKGLKLTTFVNYHIVALEEWWIASSVLPALAGKILLLSIPLAVALAIYFLANPSYTASWSEDIFPQQYFGAYGERFYYFDLVYVDINHRGIYQICREADGFRMSERYNESTWLGILDIWNFNYLWQFMKKYQFDYRVYRVNWAFCEYIGLMTHVTSDQYVLFGNYDDPYLYDVSAPWSADPAKLCKMDLPLE